MVTELQRRFCRSKFFRRGMLGVIAEETGCINGYKRVWYDCIAAAFEQLPEADIKARLYRFLQCSDLTADDRAEILQLLKLSCTALTRRQRRQIASYLEE